MKPQRSLTRKQRTELTRGPACTYVIRVQGQLDSERWSQWFEGMTVTSTHSETIISGTLPDQAALYGVLVRLRDLALPLVSVEQYPGTAVALPGARYRRRWRGGVNWLLVVLYLLLGGAATSLTVYATTSGLLHTALALGLLCAGLGAGAAVLLWLDRGWGWRLLVLINGIATAGALGVYVVTVGWLPVALSIALLLFGAAGLVAYVVYRAAVTRR